MNRAKSYAEEYREKEKKLIEARRAAKDSGSFYVEAQPSVGFLIRIRGINNVPPKPRKILQLFRLRQLHNGVFVRLTKPVLNMIQIILPYVAWGYPSYRSIRELIYKRGYATVNKQRIPITDNSVIQGQLAKYGILCIEDLVHEIYTSGPHFREVSRFLWPFKLAPPTGGFVRKLKDYTEGGDAGNREVAINKLIRRMN